MFEFKLNVKAGSQIREGLSHRISHIPRDITIKRLWRKLKDRSGHHLTRESQGASSYF